MMVSDYKSLLSATTNTRDLGGYPTASGDISVRNRIWRSDAPIVWQPSDAKVLIEHNMRTIIDLRTDGEIERHPCAYSRGNGFDYRHFPIAAGSVPPPALEDVPASYLQIAIQKETADALRTIAEAETGVLFCCTAGKDRTGVVSAILLLSCGVNREIVIDDYAVSREYNKERLEKYLSEHPEVDRRIVLANEISMARFIDLFFARFESVESFFVQAGLSLEHLQRIRRKLLEGRS